MTSTTTLFWRLLSACLLAVFFASNDAAAAESVHRDMIYRVARETRVDPALLMAVVKVESNFNHRAQNPDGPLGLTQITHSTAQAVKPGIRKADLLEPEQNLRAGALHLRQLLDEFKDPRLALAAYQAGTGRVKVSGAKILKHPHTGKHVSKVMLHYYEYKRADGSRIVASTPAKNQARAGKRSTSQASGGIRPSRMTRRSS